MMKKTILYLILAVISQNAWAGVTQYEFNAKNWGSICGANPCDGKTDGWISQKDGYEYSEGYIDAQGKPYSKGVSVKISTTGAGAQSVKDFEKVSKITFNFCQNSSKGKGVIYVQVGENPYDSLIVRKPATSGSGVYLRDSTIVLSQTGSGKVTFWIKCTENSINLNSISIYAEEGGNTPFTSSSYQLVTDIEQLQDSDQIIIGVHQDGVNKIMGYFDEAVSPNNIHAINGRYDENRQKVGGKDEAIYTLRKGQTSKGAEAWYIQDEIRYELAYLVASGGQTKNRLAIWTHLYDEKSYGDYGWWDIQVSEDGHATIMNLGNSKGKYLQYNSHNTPTLFGCYAEENQTPVCIYRRVEAKDDVQDIVVQMVNFGTHPLRGNSYEGEQTVMVNANKLTEDIQVSLKDGSVFSLSDETIDRVGGKLVVSCHATHAGRYRDTLVLKANGIEREAVVLLNLEGECNIAEAKENADFTMTYLGQVVVTKKYDSYIFVRDESGSMLIYDNGNGEGGRYGQGLANGHVLTGVTGRYQNLYGVPELAPIQAWKVENEQVECNPDVVEQVDSSDVCRYVRILNCVVRNNTITLDGKTINIENKFKINLITGVIMDMDAIVYWSYDTLTLWPICQRTATGMNEMEYNRSIVEKIYKDGSIYVRIADNLYTTDGKLIQ